jgi:predicted ATPase
MLGQVQEGIEQIREGLAIRHSMETYCCISGTLVALAQAQTMAGLIEEALGTLMEVRAFVEKTNERYLEAELYRLWGELLLKQGNEADAEVSLRKAVDVARCQSAKSWELRATISLARMWCKQDKIDEARQILKKIYGWFTEGFDTPDLKEAEALLNELS